MIKKIIFDIDDTLIMFPKKEYMDGCNKLIKKYNLNTTAIKLYNSIDKYDSCGIYKYYNIFDMVSYIEEDLKVKLNQNFIDDFFDMYNDLLGYIDLDICDTLNYLKSKYTLVIYSNWFTSSQIARLRKAGIYKYFDYVYCADKVPKKPNKEGYLEVMGDFKASECVFIGDNIKFDIEMPKSLGINVYYIGSNDCNYPKISKISDLRRKL